MTASPVSKSACPVLAGVEHREVVERRERERTAAGTKTAGVLTCSTIKRPIVREVDSEIRMPDAAEHAALRA